MAIPKFHETFVPILKSLQHGAEQKTSELPDQLLKSGFFTLSESELREQTKSGANIYHDRIWWGTVYLRQGKFVERPARGTIRITQKGLDYLKNNPEQMTLKWLKQDEDYKAYVPAESKKDVYEDDATEDMSPDELIIKGFSELEDSLKKELLEKLHESNPYFFEKIVLVLFKRMGYGDFEETKKSGDGGIDGIINQDQLGIEKIYIQSKRYAENNKVREPEIRNFIGAMSGDVSKGIFVTTSVFDNSAINKAKDARNHKIILIDGNQLVDLMIKYNIGVQIKNTYEVKSLDEDFFELG